MVGVGVSGGFCGSSMPSIPSQLFNPITDRAMESLFKDFDVERAR